MAFMNPFSRLSNFHFILEHCKVGKKIQVWTPIFHRICYEKVSFLKRVDVQSQKVSAKKPLEIRVKTKLEMTPKIGIFAYCASLCKIVLSELWISEISHFFCRCICFLVSLQKNFYCLDSTPEFSFYFFCCHTHSEEMRLVLLTWWWKFAQLICSKTRKERRRKQIKRRKNSSSCCTLQILLSDNNANFNGHKTANYTDYQSLDFCFLKNVFFFCSTYISKVILSTLDT